MIHIKKSNITFFSILKIHLGVSNSSSVTDLLLEVEDSLGQPLDIRIQLVGLPDQSNTFSNQGLNLFLKPSYKQRDG